MPTPKWKVYQEEAAAFFRSLGLMAETDVRVSGPRTDHDVDVLVTSRHAGFEVRWAVECKLWKTRISKSHVLALRQIVTDIGFDRGILLAENGFQSGAIEAAQLTNVQVTSLAAVRAGTVDDVAAMRFSDLWDRSETCRRRYWELPKRLRTEWGLRPDMSGGDYSGTSVIEFVREALGFGLRNAYPFEVPRGFLLGTEVPSQVNSPLELADCAEALISGLEQRLAVVETVFEKDPDNRLGTLW